MKKLLLLLFIIVSQTLFASKADSLALKKNQWVKIDSIEIDGNEITEDYIILRELTFSPGDSINTQILNYNKERIYSLGIFNFVSVYASKKEDKNVVIISVSESWYFYPLPFLVIKNSDIDKSTYGMIFLWKNFRGRNEIIDLKFGLGFDPFISLSYYNPIVLESANLSLRYKFIHTTASNKSQLAEKKYGESYDNTMYSTELMIGKRFDLYNTVFTEFGFDYIKTPKYVKGRITASDRSIDRVPRLSLLYQYDSRDLIQAPRNGRLAMLSLTHKGFNLDGINYNKLYLDYREYRELTDQVSTKWRIAGRHMFGKVIPFYDNSYFGFDEYIRGHRTDEREGHNYLISSFEVRYPIVDEWNLKLNLPLLPRRLTSTRIRVLLTGFFDAGLTFNNNEPVFEQNKIDKGWGLGLTVMFLPHNAYRLEYAFDEYMNGEIIFGTGFSF
ncbi:MAG: hypothetical protein JEY94_17040 [Melioribacteraceae bacterium]|nr:hypothetical protein [Melioribacteraceae bacterium]